MIPYFSVNLPSLLIVTFIVPRCLYPKLTLRLLLLCLLPVFVFVVVDLLLFLFYIFRFMLSVLCVNFVSRFMEQNQSSISINQLTQA